MTVRSNQGSFLAGTVDPALHLRADTALYRAGAKQMTNFVVLPQGGLTRRPGLTWIGDLTDTARLIPFVFNADDAGYLVFENETLKFIHNGALVGAPHTVVSPYLEAELPLIRAAQQGDLVYLAHPNHAPYLLTRLAWNSWTLAAVPLGTAGTPWTALVDADFVGAGTPSVDAKYTVERISSAGETFLPRPWTSIYSIPPPDSWATGDRTKVAFYDATISAVDLVGRPSPLVSYDYVGTTLSVKVTAAEGALWDDALAGETCTVILPGVVDPAATMAYVGQSPAPASHVWLAFTYGGPVVPASGAAPASSFAYRAGATVTIDTLPTGAFEYGDSVVFVGLLKGAPGNYHELVTINGGVWTCAGNEPDVTPPPPYTHKLYINTTETLSAYVSGGTVSRDGLGYLVFKDVGEGYGFIGQRSGPTDLIATDDVFSDWNVRPDLLQGVQTAYNPFAASGDYPRAVCFHEQRLWYAGTDNLPQSVWGSQLGFYENFNKERPLQESSLVEITVAAQRVDGIKWVASFNGTLILGTEGGIHRLSSSDGSAISPANANIRLLSSLGVSDLDPIAVGASLLVVTANGRTVVEVTSSLEADGYLPRDLTVHAAHLFRSRSIVAWSYQRAPHGVLWCVMSDGAVLSCTYHKENGVAAWCEHGLTGYAFESVATIPGANEDEVCFTTSGGGYLALKLDAFTAATKIDTLDDADPVTTAAFTSTLRTLSADTTTSTGKTRTIPSVTLGFLQADGGKVGPDLTHLDALPWVNCENTSHASAGEVSTLKCPMIGKSAVDGSFYIVADGTEPITILAVMPDIAMGDK